MNAPRKHGTDQVDTAVEKKSEPIPTTARPIAHPRRNRFHRVACSANASFRLPANSKAFSFSFAGLSIATSLSS